MLRKLRKTFVVLALVCAIAIGARAYADNNLVALKSITPEQMKLIQKDVRVNDLDIEPMNTQGVKSTAVPDTKKEGKKFVAYLIKVMSLVGLSCIIIYFILLFVRKYHSSAFSNKEEDEYFEELDLTPPNNRPDALKSFLNRTK